MPDATRENLLTGRLAELRADLEDRDPHLLATLTASDFQLTKDGCGFFRLAIWDCAVEVAYPEMVTYDAGTVQPVPDFLQAMLLYYFVMCDGTRLAGQWISFSELPNGRNYNQAFQGYTGRELAGVFQDNLPAFSLAAEKLGGERVHLFGDVSFKYQALPLVPLLVVAWLGDEDFPPNYQVLFDANASHHLPTDAYAILGSTLTKRLIKAKEETIEDRH